MPRPVLSTLIAVLVSISLSAVASDGVIEINHFTALAGGVNGDLVLDPPGYPVTITSSGSYRVTGHMPVPDANTDGIVVTALRTTIDLGGFEIRGPNQKASVPSPCTAAGAGIGVRSTLSVVVQNGRVSGMGRRGLDLGASSRIENVIATWNCSDGLRAGANSIVIGSQAVLNASHGIEVGDASRVRDSVAEASNGNGITTGAKSVVTGCAATGNFVNGIAVGAGSVVSESAASNNGGSGIAAVGGSTVVHNSLSGNTGAGISSAVTDGIGGNTLNVNGVAGIGAGEPIHCNAQDGVGSCPP